MCSNYREYTKTFIVLGKDKVRKKLILQAIEIGYEVVRMISNHSTVSKYVRVELGSVIFPHVVIESNAIIGQGWIITSNTSMISV